MRSKQSRLLSLQISPTTTEPLQKNDIDQDIKVVQTERGAKSKMNQNPMEVAKQFNQAFQMNRQYYNDIKSRVAQNQRIIQQSKDSKQQSLKSSFAMRSFQIEEEQSFNQNFQSFCVANTVKESQHSRQNDSRQFSNAKGHQNLKQKQVNKQTKNKFSVPEPEKYPERYYTPSQKIQDNAYKIKPIESTRNQQKTVQENSRRQHLNNKFQSYDMQTNFNRTIQLNNQYQNQEENYTNEYENKAISQPQKKQSDQRVYKNMPYQQHQAQQKSNVNEVFDTQEAQKVTSIETQFDEQNDYNDRQQFFSATHRSNLSNSSHSPNLKSFRMPSNENLSGLFQEEMIKNTQHPENEHFQIVLKMLYQNNNQYLESLDKLKKQKSTIKGLKLQNQQFQTKIKGLQEQVQNLKKADTIKVQHEDFSCQTENYIFQEKGQNYFKATYQKQAQQNSQEQTKEVSELIEQRYEQLDTYSNAHLISRVTVEKYTQRALYNILKQNYLQVVEKNNNLKQKIKNLQIYQKSKKQQKSKSKSKSRDVSRKSINEASQEMKNQQNDTLLKAQKIVKLIDKNIQQQVQQENSQIIKPSRSKSINSRSPSRNNQFSDQSSLSQFLNNEYSFGSDAEHLAPLRNQIVLTIKEQENVLKKENENLRQQITDQSSDIMNYQDKIKQLVEEVQLLQEENQLFQNKMLPQKPNKQLEISFSNEFSQEFMEQEDKIKKQQNQIVTYITKNTQLKNEIANLKVTHSNSKLKIQQLQDKIQILEQENQSFKKQKQQNC